jgi:ATP-dependent DNA helicase MPH1
LDGWSQVLDQFKGGAGNVLVATSIGEEGLDIGEIDMVICYDAQKTPIRMVRINALISITASS